MATGFVDQNPVDTTAIYANAQPTDPTDELFQQLQKLSQSNAAGAVGAAPVPGSERHANPPSAAPAPVPVQASAAPAAAPATPAAPAASTVGGPADPAGQALLVRLAPQGITSLDQLKGKTDAELRTLAHGVVTYETQRQTLDRYFSKNPDGSYDFSKGPDGSLTGLDPAGKPIPPPAPATPATPAATPAPTKPTSSAAKKAADLAGIKQRALKAGLKPTTATIAATYKRNQSKVTQPPAPK